MTPNWLPLLQTIATQTGHPLQTATSLKPISGGDIHQAYQIHTPKADYFLKLNQATALPLFEAEADSLNAIAQSQTIACPQPLGYGIHDQTAWLLLPYLQLTSKGNDCLRGQALAHLHHSLNPLAKIDPNKVFGWPQNNFIGHTPQYNHWHSDWVSFYAQQRLQPQLSWAKQKAAPAQLIQLGQQLIEQLPKFFTHYNPQPSLLHGDLWAGNSAFLSHGEPILYDPACYYGDRETDLAMTELFGGFSDAFYDGYQQVFPLDKDYPQRRPLYQLYHLLNHFNLFGGHYAQQAIHHLKILL